MPQSENSHSASDLSGSIDATTFTGDADAVQNNVFNFIKPGVTCLIDRYTDERFEDFTFLDAEKLRTLIKSLGLNKAEVGQVRIIAMALQTQGTKMDMSNRDMDGPNGTKFTVNICSGLLYIVRQAQASDFDD